MNNEGRFLIAYRATSIILLNFGVMFLVLNIGLAIYYGIADRFFPQPTKVPVLSKYSWETLKAAYPDLADDVLRDLLLENWTRSHDYSPFTQFFEPPFRGTYVNVDEAGFRHVADQGPWPPSPDAYNLFVFGGSTTFGYGVADNETIASYLQGLLTQAMGRQVRVYNFGTSFFYSSLERVQFQEILLAGFVPDAALFVDGLNDFRHYTPFYTKFIKRWWADHEDPKFVLGPWKDRIPLFRLLAGLRDDFLESAKLRDEQRNPITRSGVDWAETTAWVIRRYSANKRQIQAIAAAYDVEPVFVWQPMPYYKYDMNRHLFLDPDIDQENYPEGYAAMAKANASGDFGNNLIWTADIQPGLSMRLYIDYIHYSAEFSAALAVEIARGMGRKGLMGLTHPRD